MTDVLAYFIIFVSCLLLLIAIKIAVPLVKDHLGQNDKSDTVKPSESSESGYQVQVSAEDLQISIPASILGPLGPLLQDPSIEEIMVNRYDRIFVERGGRLVTAGTSFDSDKQLIEAIRRVAAAAGRRIDESSPMVDARLADGSRINAVLHPLSTTGPSLTIRKFAKNIMAIDDLVSHGTLNLQMAEFLRASIKSRKNILVSGGTSSGKTTLLNVLLSMTDRSERIVTIEDAAELQVAHLNYVSLQSRPPNLEGSGRVTIRELLINALRMRPDRIIIGECRGAETLDMLQAMNTGHDGSLTTIHANSPSDAITRLEMMVFIGGMEMPGSVIRRHIASALDVIVQTKRIPDGSRKIVRITRVIGFEEGDVVLEDVFRFQYNKTLEQSDQVGDFQRMEST